MHDRGHAIMHFFEISAAEKHERIICLREMNRFARSTVLTVDWPVM